MKKAIIIISLLVAPVCLSAQNTLPANLVEMLETVCRNNTALKAAKMSLSADSLANRTGIYLEDPEVEYGRLTGNEGNRNDFKVSQSFDLATLTGAKKAAAVSKDGLLEAELSATRKAVLTQACGLGIEIIYYNAVIEILRSVADDASSIVKSYTRMLEEGSCTAMDLTKAKVNSSESNAKLQAAIMERGVLVEQLAQLNGGQKLVLAENSLATIDLPLDKQLWVELALESAPQIKEAVSQLEVSRSESRVSRLENLPRLEVGYMGELVPGSNFRGVTLGVSIPLWSNSKAVKASRMAVQAAELRLDDERLKTESSLRQMYERAEGLRCVMMEYRNVLESASDVHLYKKALDKGGISMTDYLVEVGMLLEAVEGAIEAERDYQIAASSLITVLL